MPTRALDGLAVMVNRLEADGLGYRLPAECTPSDQQRIYLERRVSALDAYLSPATADEIADEIGGLLVALAARNADDTTKQVLFALYADGLRGLPYNAIAEACGAYRRGELGDRKWAPNPAQLRQAVIVKARVLEEERTKISRVLAARVLPPITRSSEERAAIVKREMDRFHESMAEKMKHMPDRLRPPKSEVLRNSPKSAEQERREAEEWLAQAAANHTAPPKLSPESLSLIRSEEVA